MTIRTAAGAARRRDAGLWALSAFVLGTCTYRAWTQAIYHDEALTYELFIRGSWRRPFAYTGNQEHVLYSILAKICTSLFGLSEFALRLPALVSTAVFCAAAAVFLRRFISSAWLAVAAFAMLFFNPYTMDYLIAARGYSIMMAAVMLAICLLAPADEVTDFKAVVAGLAFGAGGGAIPITLFPCVAVTSAFVLCEALSGRAAQGIRKGAIVGGVAAFIAVPLLATQMYHAQRGDYYLGAPTLLTALTSIIRPSWRHVWPGMPAFAELLTFEKIVLAATILALIGVAVLAARILARWHSATAAERVLTWLTIALALVVVQVVAAHLVAAVPYPQARTALYIIELWTLVAVLAIDVVTPSWISYLGWIVVAAVLVDDAGAFQLHMSADVPYDAAGREIAAMLQSDHAGSSRKIRVGGSWQVEPSMNFYRLSRGLDWMAEFVRDPVPSPGYDYYVLLPEDAGYVRRLGLEVRYVSPTAGTMLAVPARPN